MSVGVACALLVCSCSSDKHSAGAGTGGANSGTGATGTGTGATGTGTGATGTGTGATGTGTGATGTGTGATGTGTGATGTGTGATGTGTGATGTGGTGGTGTGGTGTGGDGHPADGSCGMPVTNATVGNTCKGTPAPAIKLTMVATGMLSPTFVTQAPGDPTRLYVLEQSGAVRVIKDGVLSNAPLLDLKTLSGAGAIGSSGLGPTIYTETGLLGMAFDPRFETNKRFWLNYTKGAAANTSIIGFTMSDPDSVDVTTGKELLSVMQGSNYNHKGGMIAFGKDGCLYIGMGDGGDEKDPRMTGQGTNDMLSVMLRVDVDKYPTPAPGNLKEHIWSTGLRNPWRFSFDRATGDMYIGDVGQDPPTGAEEINVEPSGVSGRNYGWSVAEGKATCKGDCSMMTKPAAEYPTGPGTNSVIGGYVYRGKNIPDMVGRYLYADWSERKIKTFIYKGESGTQPEVCDAGDTGVTVSNKVRSFGEDLDGELYVLAAGIGSGTGGATLDLPGTLFRIDPQ
jgi:glucose/arabinose dehydrogenase